MAEDLALILQPGDVVAVSGDLGAGKTTFCRALIKTLADNDSLEVPSPTFTLVQQYDLNRFSLAHFDLYRTSNSEELVELGFDDYLQDSVVLVEWPEKAGAFLPTKCIWIAIESGKTMSGRKIKFFGEKKLWKNRLDRTLEIRKFLNKNGWGNANRRFLEGDASTRSYEIIHSQANNVVLMDSKPQPAEAIIRSGKSYSEIAKLSQTIESFIAIDKALALAGVCVPEIFDTDKKLGLILLENLGSEPVVKDNLPISKRYLAATEVLAFIHGQHWTTVIETRPNELYHLPSYDSEAMMIEVELFLDWFVPFSLRRQVSEKIQQKFLDLWQGLIQILSNSEQSIVLRDYHSPNLLWQNDATEIGRVGLIDFQDAVYGPAVYDLVSLVQDARVDVESSLQAQLIQHYLNLRSKQGYAINEIE